VTRISTADRDLALALRRLQLEYDLDAIVAVKQSPEGVQRKLRWITLEHTGDVIEIEGEDGEYQLLRDLPADLLNPVA
jgi:hypothetical protein